MILALVGGVGGGRFARGLVAVLPPERLAIVANTGDDFVHFGLHISPDLDSVMYALADLNDAERGWGLAGETWNVMAALARLGEDTWFRLGDRDLATHMARTRRLAAGATLSQVTGELCRRLGIAHAVAPMSDAPVRTVVETDEGRLAFQDYFVRRGCKPVFRAAAIEGAARAAPAAAFAEALARAEAVIIAPSNPYLSIMPILALDGVKAALRAIRPVVAVSPIVGGAAVKGPLAKMMREIGIAPSPRAVADFYGELVSGWIIDEADAAEADAIRALGFAVRVTSTVMRGTDDKMRLAGEAVAFAGELKRAQRRRVS